MVDIYIYGGYLAAGVRRASSTTHTVTVSVSSKYWLVGSGASVFWLLLSPACSFGLCPHLASLYASSIC